MKKTFNRRHHDDKIIDGFDLKPELRYKTSGLSGDEWRVSYVLTIRRKGTILFQRGYHTPQDAVHHLPWLMRVMFEGDTEGFDRKAWEKRIDDDEKACAQPGCGGPATVRYQFKDTYTPNGEGPLPREEGMWAYVTQFCAAHSTRGNCGREDAEHNYIKLSGDIEEPDPKKVKESARVVINLDDDA
jgi:hypothetical protein